MVGYLNISVFSFVKVVQRTNVSYVLFLCRLLASLVEVVLGLPLVERHLLVQLRFAIHPALPKTHHRFIELVLILRRGRPCPKRRGQCLGFSMLIIFGAIDKFPIFFNGIFFIIVDGSGYLFFTSDFFFDLPERFH